MNILIKFLIVFFIIGSSAFANDRCIYQNIDEKKPKIMIVGDSQIDNDFNNCNLLSTLVSSKLNQNIDAFVEGGSGYVSKNIKLKGAKSFKKLTKKAKITNYDWVIWVSGADLNSIRESNQNELEKQTNKILSDDLTKGYLIKTFNFEQNKDTNFIIGLTSDLSKKLKEKKYTPLLKSGKLLIERYKRLDQKYDNVYFLPLQNFINKDDKSNYTDKYDGVHYSDKSMNILSNEIVKIINSKK